MGNCCRKPGGAGQANVRRSPPMGTRVTTTSPAPARTPFVQPTNRVPAGVTSRDRIMGLRNGTR